VREGRAYVGTFDNQVLAVDLTQGEVLWRYERVTRQFPYYSSAALTGTAVLVGGRDKALRSLDPKTGAERWVYETTGRVEASPVVVGDRVFAASQGCTIFGLEVASGREVWKFDAGASVTASPAVAGGFLVIGTDDGMLYGFGEERAVRTPTTPTTKTAGDSQAGGVGPVHGVLDLEFLR
jgi:outer membrane protein assembly factor BamB